MADLLSILDRIEKCSDLDPKSHQEKCLKLQEEVGETSQALLSAINVGGTKVRNLTMEDARNESLDCVTTALALFYSLGGNNEYLISRIDHQLTKWETILEGEK